MEYAGHLPKHAVRSSLIVMALRSDSDEVLAFGSCLPPCPLAAYAIKSKLATLTTVTIPAFPIIPPPHHSLVYLTPMWLLGFQVS